MSLASLSLRAAAGGSQMVARHAAGGLIRKVTPHAHRPHRQLGGATQDTTWHHRM